MPRCYIMKKNQQPQQISNAMEKGVAVNYDDGEWNKTSQKLHCQLKQTKNKTIGPESPTEACVAPIYYSSIPKNQDGKYFFVFNK